MPSTRPWKLAPLSFALLTLCVAACPGNGPNGPNGTSAELRVTSLPAQGFAGYTNGILTVRPAQGNLLSTQLQLSSPTPDNPSGWILFETVSVTAGDEIVVGVAPAGGATETRTCTVASRGVQLEYLDIWLGADPQTGDFVPITCGCGFTEFAGTDDANVCQI